MSTPLSSDSVNRLSDKFSTSVDNASTQANSMAFHGIDSIRHSMQEMQEKLRLSSAGAVTYIQHEPVKSVLMAAATGAALMGLISLIRR